MTMQRAWVSRSTDQPSPGLQQLLYALKVGVDGMSSVTPVVAPRRRLPRSARHVDSLNVSPMWIRLIAPRPSKRDVGQDLRPRQRQPVLSGRRLSGDG
jgi:hypothetical protein